MSRIKTPDQRVRVFVSSTLQELAPERLAARAAIERLRLIPVFFEAGARPHPPRDLYAAYLDQSHVFVGIYWNSYGWVAPGASVSGIEDEYRLCGARKPKLIYVKRSAERSPELQRMLHDIERSDTACYQLFSEADELGRLLENDLSVLMSETFENALLAGPTETAAPPVARLDKLPVVRTELIGRDDDLARLVDLLARPDVALVTLLGAGGTGKTTLATHAGQRLLARCKHGAAFVPLAAITDPRLVAPAIAEVLGVQDSGKQPLEQTLVEYLRDKELLLVLDNFEQVTEAAKVVSDLVAGAPGLKVLVTSRTSLHVRHERLFHLGTLGVPEIAPGSRLSAEELQRWPATRLFVDRALAVNPRLELHPDNVQAIVDICQRMDGLPLAIELAAARSRFFQPAALLGRIQKTLDLVSKGQRDLPERQQTLRAAIDWSYNLLSEEAQRVFRQLGVFRRSWTLEAADAVLSATGLAVDIEELTERLLDVSLIKPVLVSQSAEPRFNMLQTVHEYARERLDAAPECRATKESYAAHFLHRLEETDGRCWDAGGEAWLDWIELEHENVRASFRKYVEWGDLERAWRFLPLLAPYWTIRGGFSESLQMIADAGLFDRARWQAEAITARTRGRALTWGGYSALFLFDFQNGFPMLEEGARQAELAGDPLTRAFALCIDGCYGSYLQAPGSSEKVEESHRLAEELGDSLLLLMWLVWSQEYLRARGNHDEILANLQRAWDLAATKGNVYIQGAVHILRFSTALCSPAPDFRTVGAEADRMYALFPDKGYKGLKAAALQARAYAEMMLGDLAQSQVTLLRGLEFSRVAGEKESEIYGVMEAAGLYARLGQWPLAFRLAGALDAFLEASQYPVVGGAEVQYKHLAEVLEPQRAAQTEAYAAGRALSLSDGVVLALQG